jgi:hypothetical protein
MRIHKQRLAILVVALVGTLACFIPLGRVPLVWSLHSLQVARKVALGISGLSFVLTLVGHRDKEMRLPVQIGSLIATGLLVCFCIFRIVVLGNRTLPNFDDDDPRAGAYYNKACDTGLLEACTRGPFTISMWAWHSPATARASSVFPVPGGPARMMP